MQKILRKTIYAILYALSLVLISLFWSCLFWRLRFDWALPSLLLTALGLYFAQIREFMISWGAREEEIKRSSGRKTPYRSTRAITIEAPAEVVWGHLMRLGLESLYSYRLVDYFCLMKGRTWPLNVGDAVLRNCWNSEAVKVSCLNSCSELSFGPWSCYVIRIQPKACRLVLGFQSRYGFPLPFGLSPMMPLQMALEVAHYFLEVRALRTIKMRSESSESSSKESPGTAPA